MGKQSSVRGVMLIELKSDHGFSTLSGRRQNEMVQGNEKKGEIVRVMEG